MITLVGHVRPLLHIWILSPKHAPNLGLCRACLNWMWRITLKPHLTPAFQVPITYATAHSRTGAFYLPSKFRSRAIPVMLLFHGLHGNGLGMIPIFKVRVFCAGISAWTLDSLKRRVCLVVPAFHIPDSVEVRVSTSRTNTWGRREGRQSKCTGGCSVAP